MEDKLGKEEREPRIGLMLRGQAWVSLRGIFLANELRSLADEIDRNCKGLERKGDNKK